MNIPHAVAANNTKIGTCPHGLPLGACPICSGMGGGGGGASSVKKNDKPEMSWSECYVVWQQMQRAKALKQDQSGVMHNQMQANASFGAKLANIAQNLSNLATRLGDFAQKLQSQQNVNSKPLLLATKISLAVLNIVKDIPVLIQKTINSIQQKFADISDKLNAVFGELKNAIEKKISNKFNNFKKKLKSIFGVFEPSDIDDEEKKVEESKRLFELKTAFSAISEKFTPEKYKKELEDADS